MAYDNGKYRISMDDLAQRVDQVIRTEVGVFNSQFRRNGVDILTGRASFVNPHAILIEGPDGQLLCETQYVLIATGTRPAHNPKIPLDGRIFLIPMP